MVSHRYAVWASLARGDEITLALSTYKVHSQEGSHRPAVRTKSPWLNTHALFSQLLQTTEPTVFLSVHQSYENAHSDFECSRKVSALT